MLRVIVDLGAVVVRAMARTFPLWNDSTFASDAALSRQSSLPKSRMDNTYDSYGTHFTS